MLQPSLLAESWVTSASREAATFLKSLKFWRQKVWKYKTNENLQNPDKTNIKFFKFRGHIKSLWDLRTSSDLVMHRLISRHVICSFSLLNHTNSLLSRLTMTMTATFIKSQFDGSKTSEVTQRLARSIGSTCTWHSPSQLNINYIRDKPNFRTYKPTFRMSWM